MKLSVSNIAWNREEAGSALGMLKKEGIGAIDIAPTLVFESLEPSDSRIDEENRNFRALGFELGGMQSLLFGVSSSIFDGMAARASILEHLNKVYRIANGLGVRSLVFGSPRNRRIRDESSDNMQVAMDFFMRASIDAEKFGLDLCLEAIPKEYGCDFITTTFEAVDFTRSVGRGNFLVNLDTGTVILNGENLEEVVEYSRGLVGHVHISAPALQGIGAMDNAAISKTLKRMRYDGYVSLEVKACATADNLEHLANNVRTFKKYYS